MATINDKAFADSMFELAEKIGIADYKDELILGGMRATIPNCAIWMFVSDKKVNIEEAQQRFFDYILCSGGNCDFEMDGDYIGYSEWTITGFELNKCQLGGHDLNAILLNNIGKYVNICIDIIENGK